MDFTSCTQTSSLPKCMLYSKQHGNTQEQRKGDTGGNILYSVEMVTFYLGLFQKNPQVWTATVFCMRGGGVLEINTYLLTYKCPLGPIGVSSKLLLTLPLDTPNACRLQSPATLGDKPAMLNNLGPCPAQRDGIVIGTIPRFTLEPQSGVIQTVSSVSLTCHEQCSRTV